MSLSALFTCLFFQLYISCFNNKFEALVQGHAKIPGGCHRLGIWVVETMTWFLHSGRNYNQWGYQQVCRQTGIALLCMHNAFFHLNGEQMTLMSFDDIIAT